MNHAYMPRDINLYTNLESDRLVVNIELLVYLLPRRKLFLPKVRVEVGLCTGGWLFFTLPKSELRCHFPASAEVK